MPAPRGARSVASSETGRVRDNNQDAVFVDDGAGLWLVADGMGGHAGGARASEIACETIRDRHAVDRNLRDAVLDAHLAIRSEQEKRPEFGDMGTTIVAVTEQDADFEVCWVGDSRAYRFSTSTGQLERLTRDHNVAGMLVAAGALSPDEASRHPQRHVLTDCLGITGDHEPRIGTLKDRWHAGDWLLLCSDGLTGELSDEEIARILSDSADLGIARTSLVEQTLAAGAHDNVSVVLVAGPPIKESSRRTTTRWPWPFRR